MRSSWVLSAIEIRELPNASDVEILSRLVEKGCERMMAARLVELNKDCESGIETGAHVLTPIIFQWSDDGPTI